MKTFYVLRFAVCIYQLSEMYKLFKLPPNFRNFSHFFLGAFAPRFEWHRRSSSDSKAIVSD